MPSSMPTSRSYSGFDVTTGPGIWLDCAPRAAATGPITIHVEMAADGRTYYDMNGHFERVLRVLLVRRDRPGVRLLPNLDPRIMWDEAPPLPRPSAEEIERFP